MRAMVVMAVLLTLLGSTMAFGNENYWWLNFRASNTSGKSYTDCDIGWDYGYTDGIDKNAPSGNEDVDPAAPPLGGVLAVIASIFPGTTNNITVSDWREPLANNKTTPKVWNMAVYYDQNSSTKTIDEIKVAIKPEDGYDYPYTFGPLVITCPEALGTQKIWTFDALHPFAAFNFTVPGRLGFDNRVNVTIQAGNVVPEPGGILALSMGLIGLSGLVVRRKSR